MKTPPIHSKLTPDETTKAFVKILIVDDNKKVRDMIKGMLANSVGEFLECDNGADAFRTYDEQRPDCVLMDIEMQPVDGLTATELIKSLHPDAKIIIVTQYDSEEFKEKALEAGASGFLSKENLTGLRRVIEDVTGI